MFKIDVLTMPADFRTLLGTSLQTSIFWLPDTALKLYFKKVEVTNFIQYVKINVLEMFLERDNANVTPVPNSHVFGMYPKKVHVSMEARVYPFQVYLYVYYYL